jgi:Family of unknown function (DUF6228)
MMPAVDDYEPSVLIRSSDGRAAGTLRLSQPARPWDDDLLTYQIQVQAPGLLATVEITSLHGDAIPAFLHDLAEDFRGWPGSRNWRSLEDQFRLEATHDSLGHVSLLVRLRPRAYLDHWELCLPVTVEAGAEMTTLADALTVFFQRN